MTHSTLKICFFVAFLIPQVAWGQVDFDNVRKRAMKSGSVKSAIQILTDFVDEDATSGTDQILALEFLSRFCARRGINKRANDFVIRARELAESQTDRKLLRNVLQIESAIANNLSEYKRGVEAATRCVEIAEKLEPHDPYLAQPLNERAINYTCLNQLDLAVNDYQRALEIAEQSKNDALRLHVMANMACVYDELKQHNKSINHNLEALELARKLDNQRCIAPITVNLANAYLALEKHSEAREYFRLSLEVAKRTKDKSVIGVICTGLGDLELIDNRLDAARAHFDQALVAYKTSGDSVGVLATKTRIFKLDSLENKHADSLAQQIEELHELLAVAENKHQYHISIDALDQLIEKYQQQDNWKLVAESLSKKIEYSEQIWSKSNLAAIQKLDDAQLELAQEENYVFILIAATAGLTLMAIVLLILWRGRYMATKKLQATNVYLRRGQQENTLLEKRLSEQHKIESLATMSAGLLHDFNNYLMAIVAAAEMGRLAPDATRKNELFGNVLLSVKSASELTTSLSEYLGRGQLANSACEISNTIQDELSLWRELAGDEIDIVFERNDVTAWVNMDQTQLNQIISNIIKNSSEAIEQRGNINIELGVFDSTELQQLGEVVDEELEAKQRYCQISIRDDGAGMTTKGVFRALEPYYSTKGAGRGLGLASACGIIERHDGKLVVQSTLGVGTEISVVIPIIDNGDKANSIPDATQSNPNQLVELNTSRILVVEDEQSVRDGVKSYLQSYGIQVVLAGSGSAALDLMMSEQFDCIITDYMLGDLTGSDLARFARQQDPSKPIILISAYAEGNVFESDLFDCFLAKPFSRHQLLNSIRNVIDQSNSPSSHSHAS